MSDAMFVSGWENTKTGKFHRDPSCFSVKYAKAGELAPILLQINDPLVMTLDRSCKWCWPKASALTWQPVVPDQ